MITRLFPTQKTDPELAPYRSGLVFAFFNALTWQVGIGTPMVLFAEQLGATPAVVGLAYSFVFLLTPVQVLSTPLLPRFGFKRVTLGGWGGRSLFLFVPLVLALLAPAVPQPWMVLALVGSVFGFCLLRSIGAAAIMPWLYEILPERARGRYFSSDQFISGVAGVGTLIACATLFAWLPVYPALLVMYAIAFAGSTASYYALRQLPDAARPEALSLRSVLHDVPRHLLQASPFRTYLWVAVGYAILTTPLPPFCAYFLRTEEGLAPAEIMWFEVVRYAGVICAAYWIRTRIDRRGARPFLLLSFAGMAVVAAGWLALLHFGVSNAPAIAAIYFIVGLATATWTLGNLSYLPKVTQPAARTLMVSLHSAAAALLGGLAPTLWGVFLKVEGATGPGMDRGVFAAFFAVLLVGAIFAAGAMARLPEPQLEGDALPLGGQLLRPMRAVTYLVSLVRPRPPGGRE